MSISDSPESSDKDSPKETLSVVIPSFTCEACLIHTASLLTIQQENFLTFARKSTKSPMALIVATRRAFSTRMTKASRADVQKLVLLMAVAAYAFWKKEREKE